MAGPETSDADFTWSEFVRHNNEELAASWGNLVNRVAESDRTRTSARSLPIVDGIEDDRRWTVPCWQQSSGPRSPRSVT
ncbi:MAG: class I tRNA ligase family protein [Bifidobacterium pullorum]